MRCQDKLWELGGWVRHHTLNPCGRCCKKDQRQLKLEQYFYFVTTFIYLTQQSTSFCSYNGNGYREIFYMLVRWNL